MKNRNSASTDFLGGLLILVAIVAGFFVANALYNWEKNARTRVAASSQVKTPPTPQASGPAQVASPSSQQIQGKTAEAKPTPKEIATPGKVPAVSPKEEATPPKQEPAPTATTPTISVSQISFKQDVLPIFQKNCGFCHGTMGGLDLKDHKTLTTTGNNKPQIIPGKPEESLLIKRLEQKPLMPPSGALPAPDIQKIKQWITEGAKDN